MKTAAQELVTRKEAQGRVVEEMRRRRVTMALAASLLIGVIGSGWFAFHAGKQGRLAEKERKLADSAREEAEVSEQTTSVALDKASTLNTELTKSKENQRRMLYGAQMNLVQNAWGVDDVPQVQKLLNATRQRPGETDLRGIEWHYWQRMLHQEERVFKLPLWLSAGSALPQLNELPPGSKLSDGAAARTTFSHDGRRLAVIAAHVEDSQLVEVLKVWNTESNSVEPIFSWNLPRNSGFALFAGGKKVTEAIGGTMTSPIVSCRIVFLDAKRVVIATPASKSSEDSRMLDILERRANAAGQEKKELDKERALLSNENLATLELQTFRLDSTLDAQLA